MTQEVGALSETEWLHVGLSDSRLKAEPHSAACREVHYHLAESPTLTLISEYRHFFVNSAAEVKIWVAARRGSRVNIGLPCLYLSWEKWNFRMFVRKTQKKIRNLHCREGRDFVENCLEYT